MSPVKEFWLEANQCTGCAACTNACPVDAIEMEGGEYGFALPRITASCIDCGRCERVCGARHKVRDGMPKTPQAFAARSIDDALRFMSTSGGAFTELSRVVLSHGGVIIGAAYDERQDVHHVIVRDEEGLARLRQSKYVQSDVGFIYRDVRSLLDEGVEVLFCGAPCQIAGLVAYLGGRREGLVLLDFVCHGVNSPKAYRAWLEELEGNQGATVKRVWFKYKEGGWKSSPLRTRIDFSDGNVLVQDQRDNLYMRGYLGPNLYMRPSCAECSFRGIPLCGDLTLADFWGLDPALDDDKGTSLVIANTGHGLALLEAAGGRLRIEGRVLEEAVAGNPSIITSPVPHPRTNDFLSRLDRIRFSRAISPYLRSYAWNARIARLGKRVINGMRTISGRMGV